LTVAPEDSGACAFCGEPLGSDAVADEEDRRFCSSGCRGVHGTLGAPAGDDTAGGESDRVESGSTGDDDTVRSFLRVDGMHSVTCEEFLEKRARSVEGVVDAEASYVSETVRIEHDPGVSVGAVCDRLTTVGYSAEPRSESAIDADAATGNGLETVLGYRYAAGIVFGSFMMLTYVVTIYPVHLGSLLGVAGIATFGGELSSQSVVVVLPMFLVMTGVVVFFTGLPLLRDAYVSLVVRRPNTELLVAITVVGAYLYSTLAVAFRRTDVYYDLAFVVASAVVAAIFYESVVKRRGLARLTDLTISQLDEATRYEDGSTEQVAVEDLDPGDHILVREGERVPVDGVLAAGDCTVEEAVVTGESLPVAREAGDDIVGGSVVTADAAIVEVTDRTSSVDRLIERVRERQSADHGLQRQANRFAARLVPVMLVVALVAGGVHFALGGTPGTTVLAVLLSLLATSPWALGLATPLSVASSLDEALRRGVVIFDETIFERLRDVDVVAFDKTGTLTTGEMRVIDREGPAEAFEQAALLEARTAHPIADAVVDEFGPDGSGSDHSEAEPRADGGVTGEDPSQQGVAADADGPTETDRVAEFESHATGVRGTVDGSDLLVGHPDLFDSRGWTLPDPIVSRADEARASGNVPVIVGRDGSAEGIVIVGDDQREGWEETVSALAADGVEIAILTGDDRRGATAFEEHPEVEHVFAGVPPEAKAETVERLGGEGETVMVGDGTNDAPALAAADLGIALGSGTALAADAADVAIVTDDLASLSTTFDLSAAANRRVRQNIGWAFLYNGVAIPLAITGLLNPLFAAVAMAGSSLLVVTNSARPLLE